ncbi:MAG: alanine:cation symporter family protein [Clostridia bacterium]|nr:alanine:cation symporter family protein [Clostridia bacterium]
MRFNPVSIIVAASGIYLLFKLRFFFLIHPIRTAGCMLRGLKRRDTRRSLFLALSGTLGVGNILGVAVGIIVGGAGSVFWMLVSSVFAAALKYGEVTLATDGAMRNNDGAHGGIQYALAGYFGRLGPLFATAYSVSVILLSFSMGASMQSAALVGSVGEIFDTPHTFTVVLLAFAVLFSVVFGTRVIEKITAVVIPLTTIVYILLATFSIFICRDRLGDALVQILDGAFDSRGLFGGALGFLFSRALSEGFSRGMLSNEAGAGTSSIAHARGSSINPAASGLMGMVEVVFDTVILCTLTALAILTAIPDPSIYTDGISLVGAAFSSALGTAALYPLAFSVSAFAFSTVICWYFYSSEAWLSLFGRRSAWLLPIYLLFVILGAFVPTLPIIFISDSLLFIMTALTCLVLIKKSDRILTLSENFGLLGPLRHICKSDKANKR